MFLFSLRPSTYYIYSRNYTRAFSIIQYNKTEKGFVRQWNYQPQGNGISTWASKRVWIRGINLAGLITDKFLWFLGSSYVFIYILYVCIIYTQAHTQTHTLIQINTSIYNTTCMYVIHKTHTSPRVRPLSASAMKYLQPKGIRSPMYTMCAHWYL